MSSVYAMLDAKAGLPPQMYPLSPMQAGMLYQALLDREGGPSAGYNVEQLHLQFQEEFDINALRGAFDALLERHSVLSTSFEWDDREGPCQLLNDDLSVPVDEENLSALIPRDQKRCIEEFLERDRRRGFDMRMPPLMRVKVLVLEKGRTDLVWTFHHILFDGRCFAPLLRDLFQFYDALARGEVLHPQEPTRPYADYIQWLSERDRASSPEFFRGLLADKVTPTPLPCAEPVGRPLPASGYGERVHVLAEPTVRAARQLAERTQSTLATVVYAAWALVLNRHTGDRSPLFGSTRACRRSALGGGAQFMTGLFINTLPVVAHLEQECSVASLLGDLRRQSLALRDHEHTPLVEIQRQARIAAGTPLFETLIMFESSGLCQLLLESGEARWARCEISLHEQPSVPLTLTIYDGASLQVNALYDRSRFQPAAIERLLNALAVGLAELAVDEHRLVGDLEVLPAEERRKILFDWNDTARPFPDELCIHEPFEQQVDRTPRAPALELGDERLTYLGLEERANRLAHALRKRGAGPGCYVGVCFPRTLNLVVALLAVAKSGAAYLPLDPQYPRDRLNFMLSDANAILVLTDAQYRASFDCPLFVLDAEGEHEVAAMPSTRPARLGQSSDVCYTIFTSGSTGVPKGVVLSHRAVINTFDWVSRTFQFGPADRLLFVTSPCFDLSVFDTFGVLGSGGTVVVASTEVMHDPAALAALVVERRITVWDSAPAALQRIVGFFPSTGDNTALRLVMLSGDWIPITLPGTMRALFPHAALQSLGGATEAAIWSNWFPIRELDARWTSIPYGKPIQNSRYHVLDEQMRPSPVGVAGDLYIGGACLANGYLNRADLTAERFVPDPFHDGQLLYKTGDLARYFEDGNLEFLGRADFQVKVRGYRVELGEVEAVLGTFPGVRDVACAAYADSSGQKSLVAYVVAKAGIVLEEETIKAELAGKLPEFMVPSRVVLLDAMPLSSNGKLDRKALPSPTLRTSAPGLAGARNAFEQRVVNLWQEILQQEPIGIRDDFFKLGGHSLLAVMLVSRLKSQLGVHVPLSRIMERPTIEALVDSLKTPKNDLQPVNHVISLSTTGARPPLFLFPGTGGYSFIFRDLPAFMGPDQPIYALQAIGAEGDEPAQESSIEEMAGIYLAELLAVRPQGPFVLGGYSFGALLAFEVATRLRALGHSVPMLVSFDGFAPGFPTLLPLRERILAHGKALFNGGGEHRQEYLTQRLKNVKRRIYERMGRADLVVENIPFADLEMNDRLRKMLANLWRARDRYAPAHMEPCDLLLLKTEVPQRWIGNKMDDPLYGWERFVTGRVLTVTIPGEHLQLFQPANRPLIARAISESLATCSTRRTVD